MSRTSASRHALPKKISYAEASRLARDADTQIRTSLVGRRDIPEEVLYYLAGDATPDVRREVAQNAGTPGQADLLLARDTDPTVRTDLATKLSCLAPDLEPDAQEKLYQLTEQSLMILAQDQLVRVREILSEAFCSLTNVPQGVIECLAREPELCVAGPVLRASPLLHDALLQEIIDSEPIRGALGAIAERDGLAAPLADAIFSAGDIEATTRLLANPSAQVREETLDLIAAAAEPVTAWHEPLVQRPSLSGRAVRRIAGFVATRFLEQLRRRADLDEETLQAITDIVAQRLDDDLLTAGAGDTAQAGDGDPDWAREEGVSGRAAPVDPDWASEDGDQETAAERALVLANAGTLDETTIADAMATGDRPLAVAGFALLTELPETVLSRTIAMRNAKGIVALAWKAGFSMRLAVRAQIQLAGIAPDQVVCAAKGEEYPMDRQELLWQLGFISGDPT